MCTLPITSRHPHVPHTTSWHSLCASVLQEQLLRTYCKHVSGLNSSRFYLCIFQGWAIKQHMVCIDPGHCAHVVSTR
jgi:hypothetical protein